MPSRLACADLPRLLRPGMRVYIAGTAGESALVAVALTAALEAVAVVTEIAVADLHRMSVDGRAEALIAIATPAFRDALADVWDRRRPAPRERLLRRSAGRA